MKEKKDYYKILGVNPNADVQDIKSAYRSLARKYHPDVNPGNKVSEQKFKDIGEAYDILSDKVKRKQFDILNGYYRTAEKTINQEQQKKKQTEEAYTKAEEKKTDSKQENYSKDGKKTFNDVFNDFVDGVFKTPPTQQEETVKKATYNAPPPKKGEDITADVIITLPEAHNGTVRKVNILHTETCNQCKGKRIVNGSQCIVCQGKGEVSTHKKVNVRIPSNVKEGSKIRIPKEGNRGINGGDRGDLFLVVHIQKHSLFNVDGLTVTCEIPITPYEAALGAEINVPTIEGHVNMKIPPETSSGQKFRLSNEGITDPKTNKKGDQLITVKIEIPKNLTPKEKELYAELAKVRKYNPRESLLYDKPR
ncbi:MAG: DnaJ C-terminal domain-containing protein [bacterium]